MNSNKLGILIGIIVLFSLSELFPPWHYEYEFSYEAGYRTNGTCPAGFSFVDNPPRIKSYNEMTVLCVVDSDGDMAKIKVHKSLERLNIQRIIFSSIIFSIFLKYVAKDKKTILALSNMTIAFSSLFSVFYILFLYFTKSMYFAQ